MAYYCGQQLGMRRGRGSSLQRDGEPLSIEKSKNLFHNFPTADDATWGCPSARARPAALQTRDQREASGAWSLGKKKAEITGARRFGEERPTSEQTDKVDKMQSVRRTNMKCRGRNATISEQVGEKSSKWQEEERCAQQEKERRRLPGESHGINRGKLACEELRSGDGPGMSL